jgi:hypothetical protein
MVTARKQWGGGRGGRTEDGALTPTLRDTQRPDARQLARWGRTPSGARGAKLPGLAGRGGEGRGRGPPKGGREVPQPARAPLCTAGSRTTLPKPPQAGKAPPHTSRLGPSLAHLFPGGGSPALDVHPRACIPGAPFCPPPRLVSADPLSTSGELAGPPPPPRPMATTQRVADN